MPSWDDVVAKLPDVLDDRSARRLADRYRRRPEEAALELAAAIEGRARTVETAVHEMSTYLVGQDPARINDLWQTLYRGGFYRGGPVLMSAIFARKTCMNSMSCSRAGQTPSSTLKATLRKT